jgi:hypothetical protein
MRTTLIGLLAVIAAGCGGDGGNANCADSDKVFAWADADGDGFGDPGQIREVCSVGPGLVSKADDCDDANEEVNPFASEICNGIDDDCDGRLDERFVTSAWLPDADGDGHADPVGTAVWACAQPDGYSDIADDCDDANAQVFPENIEVCNGIDDDCDLDIDDLDDDVEASSLTTYYGDSDGDTFGDLNSPQLRCSQPAGMADNFDDCNDSAAQINPAATEVCDGMDNNCDTLIDDLDPAVDITSFNTFWFDYDGDGLGDAAVSTAACAPPADYRPNDLDCDDGDVLVLGPDNWFLDNDGDRYGGGLPVSACAAPDAYHVLGPQLDCNDYDSSVYPGALEVCNAQDDDCDGQVDDGDPDLDASGASSWHPDMDGDTYGNPDATLVACSQPNNHVLNDQDCNDFDFDINPMGNEVCNGNVDDDCDGLTDDGDPDVDPTSFGIFYADLDGDGFGDLFNGVAACGVGPGVVADPTDCDDLDPSVLAPTTWYQDLDGDGVGAGLGTAPTCVAPGASWVHGIGIEDCDDADALVFPGQVETCADGLDQNCDGIDACALVFDDFEYMGGGLNPAMWLAIVGDGAVATSPADPASSGSQSLHLGGGGATAQTLSIDTTGCISVAWSFLGKRGPEAPETGDDTVIEYFDGNNWRPTHTWLGDGVVDTGFTQISGSLTGPGFDHPTFGIRLVSTGTAVGEDDFYIDDFMIECE